MTTTKNGNGFWKWVAAGLSSVVLTLLVAGAASYTAFFRDTVPRAEISHMIQVESPYIKDQALILASLERIEGLLRETE